MAKLVTVIKKNTKLNTLHTYRYKQNWGKMDKTGGL